MLELEYGLEDEEVKMSPSRSSPSIEGKEKLRVFPREWNKVKDKAFFFLDDITLEISISQGGVSGDKKGHGRHNEHINLSKARKNRSLRPISGQPQSKGTPASERGKDGAD